jgi:hypothetical protein
MRDTITKVLAVVFFPQILIWPRDKYPHLYQYRNDGWQFNNRAVLNAARKRSVGFCKRAAKPVLFFSAFAAVAGSGTYAIFGGVQTELCIHQYQHYPHTAAEIFYEATFRYANGTEVVYTQFEKPNGSEHGHYHTPWYTDDLEEATLDDRTTIGAFIDRYSVGKCAGL